MTETHFVVQLEDITKVRVTCGSCGSTHEFPVAELSRVFGDGACRYCEHPWHDEKSPRHDAFKQLGESLKRLSGSDKYTVAFPIPIEGTSR